MTRDLPDDPRDVLAEGLGQGRAAELRDELAALGLVVVEADRLADLERAAAAHERMRQLVVDAD